jgi:hypothetical protein
MSLEEDKIYKIVEPNKGVDVIFYGVFLRKGKYVRFDDLFFLPSQSNHIQHEKHNIFDLNHVQITTTPNTINHIQSKKRNIHPDLLKSEIPYLITIKGEGYPFHKPIKTTYHGHIDKIFIFEIKEQRIKRAFGYTGEEPLYIDLPENKIKKIEQLPIQIPGLPHVINEEINTYLGGRKD